ncbi:MAG: DUF4252 domain-containing protein [Bacteroidales bacterium]|jgi:hypothetical protein
MKKLLVFIVLTITATLVYGQKSIDNLFERYAGKDGFTTVTINGNLLKLAHCFGDNDNDNSIPVDIMEIRILAQEDKSMKVENFYDMVINDIDLKNYDEFMRVKKSDQDLRMLVRSEGNKFKEFLLIAGGEDNALIQVKGNMTYDDAKKFSNDAKKKNGSAMVEIYK